MTWYKYPETKPVTYERGGWDGTFSGLCVVALSKNLKLTTTHSWAITQNPCYVPLNYQDEIRF